VIDEVDAYEPVEMDGDFFANLPCISSEINHNSAPPLLTTYYNPQTKASLSEPVQTEEKKQSLTLSLLSKPFLVVGGSLGTVLLLAFVAVIVGGLVGDFGEKSPVTIPLDEVPQYRSILDSMKGLYVIGDPPNIPEFIPREQLDAIDDKLEDRESLAEEPKELQLIQYFNEANDLLRMRHIIYRARENTPEVRLKAIEEGEARKKSLADAMYSIGNIDAGTRYSEELARIPEAKSFLRGIRKQPYGMWARWDEEDISVVNRFIGGGLDFTEPGVIVPWMVFDCSQGTMDRVNKELDSYIAVIGESLEISEKQK
jgi:hypothetical protein